MTVWKSHLVPLAFQTPPASEWLTTLQPLGRLASTMYALAFSPVFSMLNLTLIVSPGCACAGALTEMVAGSAVTTITPATATRATARKTIALDFLFMSYH